jgi:hypothetical protein
MSNKSTIGVKLAGTITAALLIGAHTAGSTELPAPAGSQKSYLSMQSISYDFGSKSMRGYFLPENGKCSMVLMIAEKIDPDGSAPVLPTRVRLALAPGEIVSVDSEAAIGLLSSLSFSCSEDAKTLSVFEDKGSGTNTIARGPDN